MKEQKTLNQWRKERGLAVDELAEKAGAGLNVGKWLYSGVTPRVQMCFALAKALDVELDQIIWGKVESQEVPEMPAGPEATGNQSRISREQYEVAKQWLKAGRMMTEISQAVGVSRGTLYKAFAKFEKEDGLQKASEGPAPEAAESKVKTRKPKASKADS
ncbi:hypothetical protein [Deinococcus arenicola]|uniref:HTH cro/C1-type domain-containing protein n=1 Tax=Deinococcus arenicola TaxID=2994950 RepID=A0ABU4DVG8_9DEIO|nr:hypothetical protein [Deinococcus sp. ZS9-10]MDV6376378.1 hypothetical protein [Deinococcus sp. ZS9-10]